MKQTLLRWIGAAAAACGLACAQGAAFGQTDPAASYPDRQIRIIVPYSAGGSTDALGRLVAAELSNAWKQPVIVENRAGAGGNIGGAYVAPAYVEVVDEVSRDLSVRADAAQAAGIPQEKIILDPGIGFGKTPQDNLTLIAHLGRIKALGFPLLMGVSRKSFIGHILNLPVEERLEGTAACVTACVLRGADILRVHDVKFMARVVHMAAALRDA